MTKKLVKAKVEAEGSDTAPAAEGGEVGPLDNVGRLRTHLKADCLASKLLDAWTGAEPRTAKPKLLKAVDEHNSEKK
jgi:hypothetical protein